MAEVVIKKDGSREPFQPEKIRNSIATACGKAGITGLEKEELVEKASQIALDAAEKREEITTTEIRGKLLTKLEKLNPSVAEAWRDYDKERGRI